MRELWQRQRAVAREKAKQLFDETEPEDIAQPLVRSGSVGDGALGQV